MFIEPDTAPERSPPMSMQRAELGLMVISTPNTATPKHTTNARAEPDAVDAHNIKPSAPSRKSLIAGPRREPTRNPYNQVTKPPEAHWANMPKTSATGARTTASRPQRVCR
jgi:hypothetical protein